MGEILLRCPACDRITTWSTSPMPEPRPEPKTPYRLSFNDRKFLKALRIGQDEEGTHDAS